MMATIGKGKNSAPLSDIEIARAAELAPIDEIGEKNRIEGLF